MGRTSKGHTYVQGTYVGVRADATLTRSQRGTRACARVDTTPCCVSLRHIKMPINASRAECGPESPSLPRQEASQQKELRGERGTVALRHEARCTCQCCPGLLSARPMGGRCLCCCGMPHGCDWPAPRRVSSARRSHRGQRNSPGLNAQPGAPARAGASHGACNASECSPRLAQMRPSSPPTVHRLLKKHCDESAMNAAPQAGDDAVMGWCGPSE